MVNPTSKALALVISAIKNLREIRGSTSKEILNYISAIYDSPEPAVKRQMQTALKRGLAYGILKKADGHYTLPTDNDTDYQEIAAQELGLLNLCCRKRQQAKRKRKSQGCGKKGASRRKKKSKKKGKMSKCKCGKKAKKRKKKSRGCKAKRKKKPKKDKFKCICGDSPKKKKKQKPKGAVKCSLFEKDQEEDRDKQWGTQGDPEIYKKDLERGRERDVEEDDERERKLRRDESSENCTPCRSRSSSPEGCKDLSEPV
ncbi:histone H5 [Orussus abietinus]|uniref:histone H5 n=1 Tax=Orussus abietinus TaxID=222816 RepID=UPI000625E714|nr:histone H5 [Orussus abietinus]